MTTRSDFGSSNENFWIRLTLLVALSLMSAIFFGATAGVGGEVRVGAANRFAAAVRDAFVASVSELAVLEAGRSGVPASVTAAQAIIESDWGRSPLARGANNYFGIKCKSAWTGPSVQHGDDDRDASGAPVESCFRAYASVGESFRDHSDFLSGSARYATLFTLDPNDYRAWAAGLQRCGYATDEAYAQRIVAVIERLGLDALDWADEDLERWLVAVSEESRPPQNVPSFSALRPTAPVASGRSSPGAPAQRLRRIEIDSELARRRAGRAKH